MDDNSCIRARRFGGEGVMFKNMGFWGIITLIFIGFFFVAVMTHAAGLSAAAGTLFTGHNGVGNTLESPGTATVGGTNVPSSKASRMAFAA